MNLIWKKIDFKDERIVFIHIPKTAGTSLAHTLSKEIGEYPHFRTRMQKIENFRNNLIGEYISDVNQFVLKYKYSVIDKHYLVPQAVKQDYAKQARFIWGHFRIGDEPPSRLQSRYISLVRSPTDRFISQYYFALDRKNRLTKGHINHPLLDSTGKMPETPEQFLEMLKSRSAHRWINGQCRHFSKTASFKDARETIEKHPILVAPLDRYNEFLVVLSFIIGNKKLESKKINEGVSRNQARIESDWLQTELNRIFSQDRMLYEYCMEKFDTQFEEFKAAVGL
jgi:hypothetical protein